MADAVDSKSTAGNGVGVQVPSRAVMVVAAFTYSEMLLSM